MEQLRSKRIHDVSFSGHEKHLQSLEVVEEIEFAVHHVQHALVHHFKLVFHRCQHALVDSQMNRNFNSVPTFSFVFLSDLLLDLQLFLGRGVVFNNLSKSMLYVGRRRH